MMMSTSYTRSRSERRSRVMMPDSGIMMMDPGRRQRSYRASGGVSRVGDIIMMTAYLSSGGRARAGVVSSL